MAKTKIGIIGIGHLGSRHLKVYSELADQIELAGVCDAQAARTQKLANHYKIPFVRDYQELIGKVDAVNICTPTETHYDIAKFFLKNRQISHIH